MIQRVHIAFGIPRAERDRFYHLLEAIECLEGWKESCAGPKANPSFAHEFFAGDPRIETLRAAMRGENLIYWQDQTRSVYSLKELRASPLLELNPYGLGDRDTGRQPADVYDFSTGCPLCHTGARQVKPLRVNPESLPKKGPMCCTHSDFVLITEPLHRAIVDARLTGLRLRPVVSHALERLAWWQLDAFQEMPPMAAEAKGFVRGRATEWCPGGCPECNRDNWFTDGPTQIVYSRSELGQSPLPDICFTYEHFGVSAFDVNGYIARPITLVSPKFMDILLTLKIRGLRFNPVVIVGP